MNQLVALLHDHVFYALREEQPKLAEHAPFIVDCHLDPRNYAMPMHDKGDDLVERFIANPDYESLQNYFVFEQTHTIEGIIRVMVRTHLNRQGMGNIVQGAQSKTLAARAMIPFTGNFDYHRMAADHSYFIQCYEQAAQQFPHEYRPADIDAIQKAKQLSGAQQVSTKLARARGVTGNWDKFLTGVYSGLLFLQNKYQFDAEAIWQDINRASCDAQSAKNLVKQFKKGIHQYGTALAGSFLADLGPSQFVKPDVHVLDSVAAIFARDNVTEDFAVDYVYTLAERLRMPPRMVDKIFYLGCSGNFYLLGTSIKGTREYKQKFLQELKRADLA